MVVVGIKSLPLKDLSIKVVPLPKHVKNLNSVVVKTVFPQLWVANSKDVLLLIATKLFSVVAQIRKHRLKAMTTKGVHHHLPPALNQDSVVAKITSLQLKDPNTKVAKKKLQQLQLHQKKIATILNSDVVPMGFKQRKEITTRVATLQTAQNHTSDVALTESHQLKDRISKDAKRHVLKMISDAVAMESHQRTDLVEKDVVWLVRLDVVLIISWKREDQIWKGVAANTRHTGVVLITSQQLEDTTTKAVGVNTQNTDVVQMNTPQLQVQNIKVVCATRFNLDVVPMELPWLKGPTNKVKIQNNITFRVLYLLNLKINATSGLVCISLFFPNFWS